MTDFAALIETAVKRDLRDRFLAFLSEHRLGKFGQARSMTPDEKAMALACFDGFLIEANFLDLGVVEIRDLRSRLCQLTRPNLKNIAEFTIANTCFDALACITALEARLCRCLDRAEVRRLRWPAPAAIVANDP